MENPNDELELIPNIVLHNRRISQEIETIKEHFQKISRARNCSLNSSDQLKNEVEIMATIAVCTIFIVVIFYERRARAKLKQKWESYHDFSKRC